MKLLLALSVLLVTLFVLAESSPTESRESSLKDHLKTIKESIIDVAGKVKEKTKSAIQKLHDSEFATKTRRVFTEGIQKLKDKFQQ